MAVPARHSAPRYVAVVSRRLRWSGGLLGAGAVAWLPLASTALCTSLHTLHDTSPWTIPVAAAVYWWDYSDNPAVAHWLPICAVGAAMVAVIPAMVAMCWPGGRRLRAARPGEPVPPPVRASSDLHGHAAWMGEPAMRKLAVGGHPVHGGVVYGTTCRAGSNPSNDGGTSPLLIDRCTEDATHGLLFLGSGGGKTSAFVVPTLDPEPGWRANVLVNDPSAQAGRMCAQMRKDAGQRVVFLGPGSGRVGINVLGWIDPTHPQFEEHVWSAVETLGREVSTSESNNPNGMFKIQGRALQACLLADMLADPAIPKADKTPLTLASRVATPEKKMKGLLETIHEESHSRLARILAGTLMEAHPKTFSGFCVEATADLRWLMTQSYAELVSGTAAGSLQPGDFTRGNTCVFLQLGVKTMEDTPQIGRAILNALLNDIYRADGATNRRYLLLLDEIDLFGKMQALATAASQGRKYGVTIVGMWHSLGQMETTWGAAGARTWRANASWEAYSAMDPETAKAVSERCGTYTALARSEGRNMGQQSGMNQGSRSSGYSENTSLQARKLISPDEVERDMRKDEQIVFKRGEAAPIRCVKAYYFRRPDMAAKVDRDQYRNAAE